MHMLQMLRVKKGYDTMAAIYMVLRLDEESMLITETESTFETGESNSWT